MLHTVLNRLVETTFSIDVAIFSKATFKGALKNLAPALAALVCFLLIYLTFKTINSRG